jgi:hypothetical protein
LQSRERDLTRIPEQKLKNISFQVQPSASMSLQSVQKSIEDRDARLRSFADSFPKFLPGGAGTQSQNVNDTTGSTTTVSNDQNASARDSGVIPSSSSSSTSSSAPSFSSSPYRRSDTAVPAPAAKRTPKQKALPKGGRKKKALAVQQGKGAKRSKQVAFLPTIEEDAEEHAEENEDTELKDTNIEDTAKNEDTANNKDTAFGEGAPFAVPAVQALRPDWEKLMQEKSELEENLSQMLTLMKDKSMKVELLLLKSVLGESILNYLP